jgi:hypothetical protein
MEAVAVKGGRGKGCGPSGDRGSVRRCLERNCLSNPRRIHSKKKDEEKEE